MTNSDQPNTIDSISRKLTTFAINQGLIVTDARADRLNRTVRELVEKGGRSAPILQTFLAEKLYDVFLPHMTPTQRDESKEMLAPIASSIYALASERSVKRPAGPHTRAFVNAPERAWTIQ